MSGSQIVWKDPGAASNLVPSVFGRIGNISAQAGDYTTDLVTEGNNLYFTDVRAQNALSGVLFSLSSDISSISGTALAINTNLTNLSTSFNTLSGIVSVLGSNMDLLMNSVDSLSGSVNTINTNLASLA